MNTNKPAKPPIIHNGRPYVSMTEYRERGNFANSTEVTKRVKEGMPHIVVTHGKQPRYYFNLEDCGDWHAGGHLEGKKERAG